MMRWFVNSQINKLEAQLGESIEYLRILVKGTPWLFWKYLGLIVLSAHHRHCPKNALHMARIAAAQVEDCGPCVQINVNFAQGEGIPVSLIQGALDGGAGLPEPERTAYEFGRSVAHNTDDLDIARQRAVEVFGDKAVHDLAIAVATARVYPVIKRGLGVAQSCSIVRPQIQ